jgi:hypothetical protein
MRIRVLLDKVCGCFDHAFFLVFSRVCVCVSGMCSESHGGMCVVVVTPAFDSDRQRNAGYVALAQQVRDMRGDQKFNFGAIFTQCIVWLMPFVAAYRFAVRCVGRMLLGLSKVPVTMRVIVWPGVAVWANGASSAVQTWAQALEVEPSDSARLVVVLPHKARSALHVGAFSVAAIADFVAGTLSGVHKVCRIVESAGGLSKSSSSKHMSVRRQEDVAKGSDIGEGKTTLRPTDN